MTYTAIVAVENNRVSKYQQFDEQSDAIDHAATHGGFVVETPAAPISDWLVDEVAETVTVSPVPPTNEQINAERDRRIAAGLEATVTGIGTFKADTRDERDFRNINGLASKGLALIIDGDLTTTTTFRDADNIDRVMTGPQLVEFGASIAAKVDELYKAAWALKSMDPKPLDYTDNSYWVAP